MWIMQAELMLDTRLSKKQKVSWGGGINDVVPDAAVVGSGW